MSILIDKTTRLICQGMTGKQGRFHTAQCLQYGTQIVAGVTPRRHNQQHLDVPIFSSVKKAVNETHANASMLFVPAPFCKDAIVEAIDAGIKLIVCITQGLPLADWLFIKHLIKNTSVTLLGPNSPGIITPRQCKIGVMPEELFLPGKIGLVSRSGTLFYESAQQILTAGFGQSTAVGIAGDPMPWSNFIDMLKLFEKDPATEAIVLIGEIGSHAEEEAAEFIKSHISKPVIAHIAGSHTPIAQRMGHAGTLIVNHDGKAKHKIVALARAGVEVVKQASDITTALLNIPALHHKTITQQSENK